MTARLSTELADVLALIANDHIQARTAAILEIARQAQPNDIGAYLMGIGMGELLSAGRSDEEIVAIMTESLGRLRALITELHREPEEAPS